MYVCMMMMMIGADKPLGSKPIQLCCEWRHRVLNMHKIRHSLISFQP